MTAIGQEFVSFSLGSNGQYSPSIACCLYNGKTTYRNMTRDDISNIYDDNSIPGGWIFKKGTGISSWARRFALLRNEFMFMFHSPLNEKPFSVIPLSGCNIVKPDDNAATFEIKTNKKSMESGGFEFEIRHPLRGIARLYALSEQERDEWIEACSKRTGDADGPVTILKNSGSNISVSSIKLSGFIMDISNNTLPDSTYPISPPPSAIQVSANVNNQATRGEGVLEVPNVHELSSEEEEEEENSEDEDDDNDILSDNKEIYNDEEEYNDKVTIEEISLENVEKEVVKKTHENTATRLMLEKTLSSTMKLQEEGRKREKQARKLKNQDIAQAREKESLNPMTLSALFRYLLYFIEEELVEDPLPNTPLQIPHLKGDAAEHMIVGIYKHYCGPTGFMTLEEFINFIEESGVLYSHSPRDEKDEPLEEFRALLDPVRMLSSIPRNLGYTSDMILSHEKEWNPKNKSGAASPTRRASTMSAKKSDVSGGDTFRVNFTQFYQLLLRITQVVYFDLYEKDMTLAFNKILQESICPLYAWIQGHSKRGSIDVLVRDERIPLLMVTYAPNLWKVFLFYAKDPLNKLPDQTCKSFPEPVQQDEKSLFGPPPGIPVKVDDKVKKNKDRTCDTLLMNELAVLRLCADYGLTPNLCSQRHAREIFREVNRKKRLIRHKAYTKPSEKVSQIIDTDASLAKKKSLSKHTSSPAPMHFNGAVSKSASTVLGSPPHVPSSPTPQTTSNNSTGFTTFFKSSHMERSSTGKLSFSTINNNSNGISFSEFVEFICRLACESMQVGNYALIFPSNFSKVLAILTLYSVADLSKLEEVRAIHSDEII
jgi:hypothetical protein